MGTVPPPPSTPEAKVPTRLTADTPHVFNQTSFHCTADSELPVSRRAVANDLGQAIPQVDLAWFEANLLPPLPEGLDLEDLIAKLKHEKVIRKGRWDVYQVDPRHVHKIENQAFAPLQTLIGNIIACGQKEIPTSKQLLRYRSLPTIDMVTIYDDKPSKPDGYFVPTAKKSPQRYYWHQIGVPGEYKLSEADTEAIDNRLKTTWNLYQQFREDPRRRFALAYTIENTTMRLWFANRSEVLVSEPFNFVTDHEAFVGFVMRIAFAKQHQIGWDTTMKLRSFTARSKSGPMYDITVHAPNDTVVYRTKKLLNDIGARSIRGRGTRVWEVVKLNPKKTRNKESKQRFALKDSWVDADRRREVDILESVKKADGSDIFQKTVNNYLLTVDSYGDVLIDVDPANILKLPDHDRKLPDHTRDLHTNGQKISEPATLGRIALVETALYLERRSITQRSTTKNSEKMQELRSTRKGILGGSGNNVNYHEKQHHRAVFNEVGTSLYEQTSLFEVFRSLALVAGVLADIHQAGAGWVHRDISPGNILVFPGKNGATPMRLADFEYAKEITDHTSHELRTGTQNFISAEADARVYSFAGLTDPKPEEPLAKKAKLADAMDARTMRMELLNNMGKSSRKHLEQAAAQPAASSKPSSAVFFHNALHDLESIWWIAVWFLIAKEVKSSTLTSDAPFDTTEQRHLADKLFYNHGERLAVMSKNAIFMNYVQYLHPSVRKVGEILVSIKTELLAVYEAAEKDPQSIGKGVASTLYDTMMDHLGEAAEELLLKEVVVGKLTRPVAKEPEAANAAEAGPEAGPSAAGSRKRKSHD